MTLYIPLHNSDGFESHSLRQISAAQMKKSNSYDKMPTNNKHKGVIVNKTHTNRFLVTMLGAFLLAISYSSLALAQTAATQPSDYAADVKTGQATLQSDPVAAASAKEVQDSENDEGEVDNEPVEVKEAVEPQEATEAAETSDSGDHQ